MSLTEVPLTPMGTEVGNSQVHHSPQSENMNPQYSYEESDDEIRNKIWGPYYRIALTTFQLFPFNKNASGGMKFLSFLPNLVAVLLLLTRGIYMLIRMSSAIPLSLFWAYSGILFFTSLHGLIGAFALLVYKQEMYIRNTIQKIRITTRDMVSSSSRQEFILSIFIYAFVIIPSSVYIYENYIMYDRDVTDLLKIPNITANETARFRESILGNRHLFFIDAIVIVIGAYLVANALIIYLRANRAICKEYEKFNQKLKKSIEDASILQRPVIKAYEAQLIDYISTARFITNTACFLIDVTFMAGLFIQISAQFALKAYGPKMYSIQNVLMGMWTAQSIYFLFIATRRPAVLQNLLTETTALLWLDHGIWSKNEDPLIREIARSMTSRIDSVDYASKGLSPTKASNIVFSAIMFVVPFIVDILAKYKYVPWYQTDD